MSRWIPSVLDFKTLGPTQIWGVHPCISTEVNGTRPIYSSSGSGPFFTIRFHFPNTFHNPDTEKDTSVKQLTF